MPRAFNGAASITTSIGGLGAFNSGAMVCIAQRTDEAGWHGIVVTIQSGGGANEAYLDIAPSAHATASAIWSSWGSTDNSGSLKFNSSDGWCIIAVTKAAGSATPRYHKYVFSTGTWSHGNGGGAVADATSTPGGNLKFGDVGGDALNGDLAAVALYGRTFTDQEIESLVGGWEIWLGYGPLGAWLFDQRILQTLVDWVGTANQTAITGTTMSAASVPVWNQTDGSVWVAEITAAAGTSAPAENAAATGTGQDASTALTAAAEAAATSAAGQDPAAAVAPAAGNAAAGGAGNDPAAAVAAAAECATAAATAHDATASTSAGVNAAAECAAATGNASDAAAAAGAAAEAVTASAAAAGAAPGAGAAAGQAAGSAAAGDAAAALAAAVDAALSAAAAYDVTPPATFGRGWPGTGTAAAGYPATGTAAPAGRAGTATTSYGTTGEG